jgi:hypothetical protein
MFIMGFFVFVWFVLATSGNDENDFVDGNARAHPQSR